MRLIKFLPGRMLTICLLASFSALANTQDVTPNVADASLEELGQIKVYAASKHLQAGEDAPSSVTVITSDEIQRYGYRTLAEILQTVPGFFVTYDRIYSSLGVRGFARPGDYNTRILLLVDGHRLNDNIYDEAMIGTEFPIDIDLISRVEVVRGPISSLYGSNALFAVVNIVTRHGRDVRGLELSAEAASFNTYAERVSYGKKLRPFEVLISSTFYGSRGHNQLYFPEFNTPDNNHGLASHADDDQSSNTLATISLRDFTFQGVYGIREKGIPTAAYDTLFNVRGTRTTDSHGYFDVRYEHTYRGAWNVLARAFYDRYSYQGTYLYPPSDDSDQVNTNLDYADGKWWGTETQVTKSFPQRNRLTAGGEFRENLRQDQANFNLNPFSLLLDDRRSSLVSAVYVQDEVTISKTLTLNAGFRYDYYDHMDASVDPRAALVYRPSNQSAFKVIFGESFRIPNVYELYYSILPNVANPLLKPEKIRTTEVVWEQTVKNRLWFSTSAFFNDIDDLITQVQNNDGSLIFQNMQDANSSGIELQTKVQWPKGLESTASYSFQETWDESTDRSLSNSPRSLIKLNLSQPLAKKHLFLSLDAQYRSRIEVLGGGSTSPSTVVNATLLTRNLRKRLDLSGGIYNLFDIKYFDPPSSANLNLPIQQDGRSFRVKLTWHPGER